MTYDEFIAEYLAKGLIKKQKADLKEVVKVLKRARIDLKIAKVNIEIDEGIVYSVAYLAMLRAGGALMLFKGFRPDDGNQHKTVVKFTPYYLGNKFKTLVAHFDRMRRKRNIFMHDIEVSISGSGANTAFETAVEFVNLIEKRIKKEQPQIEFEF
ncbi:MAG: hypothetical protein ABIL40_11515 [candidate division WOR-3 bacterium]